MVLVYTLKIIFYSCHIPYISNYQHPEIVIIIEREIKPLETGITVQLTVLPEITSTNDGHAGLVVSI